MKRRRLYVPLSVDYYLDEKVAAVAEISPWCEVLWTRSLARAKHVEANGELTFGDMAALHINNWRKWATNLVDAGLLEKTGNGFRIVAWNAHNLTTAEIQGTRDRKAANVTAYRERKLAENDACNRPVTGDVTGNTTGYIGIARSLKLEDNLKVVLLEPETSCSGKAKTVRERDLLFDALALNAEGILNPATMTKIQARAVGVATAEIRKAGGTPDQIVGAVAAYRAQFPNASITANAVAKHWGRLTVGAGNIPGGRQLASTAASRQRASMDVIDAHLAANGSLPGIHETVLARQAHTARTSPSVIDIGEFS